MIRSLTLILIGGLCAAGAWGCKTYEIVNGRETEVREEPREDEKEKRLLKALEEHPEDLRLLFELAQHYEKEQRTQEAYQTYMRFQQQAEKVEKEQKITGSRRSTLGHFRLAELCYREKTNGNLAAVHYIQVLDRQPDDIEQAKLNPHFRTSHLRLAQLYFRGKKNDKAYLHVMIHKELGGDGGDGILVGLERRKEQGEFDENSVSPSQPRGKGNPSQPAGKPKKQ